jgi:hypothetical protein
VYLRSLFMRVPSFCLAVSRTSSIDLLAGLCLECVRFLFAVSANFVQNALPFIAIFAL